MWKTDWSFFKKVYKKSFFLYRIIYKKINLCYTNNVFMRVKKSDARDSPYSEIGHSDHFLICGDYKIFRRKKT